MHDRIMWQMVETVVNSPKRKKIVGSKKRLLFEYNFCE